jgi:hypothetical protein
MRIDVTTPDDFYKYYSESYVRSKTEQGGVYYVAGYDRGAVSLRKVANTGRFAEGVYRNFATLEDDIFFGLPPLGMVVYKDMLFFVAQDFKRTGCRGLSRHRGKLYSLSENSLMNEYVETIRRAPTIATLCGDAKFARAVLWPDYTGQFRPAFRNLLSGDQAAAAIDRDFGGFLSENFKYPVLCYKTHRIGEIQGEGLVRLLPTYSGFKPILQAALAQAEIKIA